jgi:hypothetical protein
MKYIGNCSDQIDWNTVITKCKTGSTIHYNLSCFPNTEHFKELDRIWQEAGYQYDDPSIEWINYFAGEFGQEVVDQFAKIVDAKPWMVWISKIKPARMAPLHQDAHSKIDELLSLGSPVRYTCYIQDGCDGHASIVNNVAIYKAKKGDIYEWSHYDAWHAGGNCGLHDKFMFNFWGYK